MYLISGGKNQGKLNYVQKLFFEHKVPVAEGANCLEEELFTKPVINHFHLWVARYVNDMDKIEEVIRKILRENSSVIIIVEELGCGIVPFEKADRVYREINGRICCELASKAKEVHRVICGIGTVIKHA